MIGKTKALILKALHTYSNPSFSVKGPFQKVSLQLKDQFPYETMKDFGISLKNVLNICIKINEIYV